MCIYSHRGAKSAQYAGRDAPLPVKDEAHGLLTLGCASELLMAASMMAIFSRFSAPLMLAGSRIVFTATTVPRHRPRYTLPNCGLRKQGAGFKLDATKQQLMLTIKS